VGTAVSFAKILVANRGEIACRVIRTARALGYRTVAVFSDADADAPHVRQADEAVRIGPPAAADSYLDINALLAAARATGADAVHPGYGFLSERADFAQACADAGLVFIGPPPAAIEAMGNKAGAKRRMVAAGVPCAPGYLGEAQDDATLGAQALALGFPLLVKAVAGGGGRGMRLVHRAEELPAALAGARRESLSAFGDATLMLERLITPGRHIEIQVFADAHGNAVHLGERDCSAQRRRQKVIEEAPSPIVDAALRARMGADAVAAALAVGYVGAGTVEFIVAADLTHYFLEMNTRLQVEHPVTECITGLDLVEWQLRVAAGEPLPLRQDQITFAGHAIEARLYAEDPYDGFKPQTGRILHWQPGAALQPGVRIDHGIAEGGEITPWYDAMVAKIIVHGRDRSDAIRRLRAALAAAPLLGPLTNSRFLHDLVGHPAFTGAALHTTLIDDWAANGEALLQRPAPDDKLWLIAATARALSAALSSAGMAPRPAGLSAWQLTLHCQGENRVMTVQSAGNTVQVTMQGATHRLTLLARDATSLRISLDGVQRRLVQHDDGRQLQLVWLAATFVFSEPSPWPTQDRALDARRVLAPVAGTVAQVAVAVGDAVTEGQPLVCVEAMKMELWQHAAAAGTVAAVHVAARDSVAAGALLIELTLTDPKDPP
jgi:geranyl-CoA carboxylase alpha subunit